jgi:hypothetical protein
MKWLGFAGSHKIWKQTLKVTTIRKGMYAKVKSLEQQL